MSEVTVILRGQVCVPVA